MSEEVLKEVLAEFKWPISYSIEEDLPDGIEVIFSNCCLYFQESGQGMISVDFVNDENIGVNYEYNVSIFSVIQILKKQKHYNEPKLEGEHEVYTSLEKVKRGIRNECVLIQHYLLPTIQGDFSWVEEFNYQKRQENL